VLVRRRLHPVPLDFVTGLPPPQCNCDRRATPILVLRRPWMLVGTLAPRRNHPVLMFVRLSGRLDAPGGQEAGAGVVLHERPADRVHRRHEMPAPRAAPIQHDSRRLAAPRHDLRGERRRRVPVARVGRVRPFPAEVVVRGHARPTLAAPSFPRMTTAAPDEKAEVIRVRSRGRAGMRYARLSRANSPGPDPRVTRCPTGHAERSAALHASGSLKPHGRPTGCGRGFRRSWRSRAGEAKPCGSSPLREVLRPVRPQAPPDRAGPCAEPMAARVAGLDPPPRLSRFTVGCTGWNSGTPGWP
jgi:hypothetical protein